MLNINEKLIDNLPEDEFYLLCVLARYGKKCAPSNDVLLSKTNWGYRKLQKVKKSLLDGGFIEVVTRWKTENGKPVRDSNQYRIKSKLIGKYNKEDAEIKPIDSDYILAIKDENGAIIRFEKAKSELVNSELYQSELVQNDIVQSELVQSELYQNGGGNKLLKVIIIESNKLLKVVASCKSENSENAPTKIDAIQESELARAGKWLTEIEELSDSNEALPKYEKADKRINKHLPFSVADTKVTLTALYPDLEALQEEVHEQKGIVVDMELLKAELAKFITDGMTNYYANKIRTVTDLNYCLINWIERGVKYSRNNPTPKKDDFNDFETFYKEVVLENRANAIRRHTESGEMQNYCTKYNDCRAELLKLANEHDNESINPYTLFRILNCYPWSILGGSKPERVYESFKTWLSKQSDYIQKKGDIWSELVAQNKKYQGIY